MSWLDLLGRAYVLGGLAWVGYVFASIAVSARYESDPDEDPDAWDRGHDQWVDEQTGVTPW